MGEFELTWVVALFGIAIILLGILGLVRPGNLMRLVLGAWQSRKGFYFSIGIRVVFGIVLLLAASQSRFPEAFRILGIISLVAGDPTAMLHPSVEKTYQEARDRLEALIPEEWLDEKKAKNLVVKSSVLTASSPAQAITQFAQGKNADLIIVGTHGRKGLTRMLMGSTAESLLRRSPCPVLVVKHKVAATAA